MGRRAAGYAHHLRRGWHLPTSDPRASHVSGVWCSWLPASAPHHGDVDMLPPL